MLFEFVGAAFRRFRSCSRHAYSEAASESAWRSALGADRYRFPGMTKINKLPVGKKRNRLTCRLWTERVTQRTRRLLPRAQGRRTCRREHHEKTLDLSTISPVDDRTDHQRGGHFRLVVLLLYSRHMPGVLSLVAAPVRAGCSTFSSIAATAVLLTLLLRLRLVLMGCGCDAGAAACCLVTHPADGGQIRGFLPVDFDGVYNVTAMACARASQADRSGRRCRRG